MSYSGLAALARRRSMVAGATSVALHGALAALATALAGSLVAHAPRRPAVTDIEIVNAVRIPDLPVAAHASPPAAIPAPRPVARGRRAPEAPQRSPSRPAAIKDVLDDVKLSYDDPDNFAGRPADAPVDGERRVRSALGAGVDRSADAGLATLQMPAPASASLARAPRPKHDYHQLRMHSVSQFAGLTIKLLLMIDARGVVREVRVLQGVERHLDERTVALVHKFEFEPALDDVGTPIAGSQRWDIQIVDEAKESIKPSLARGFY